MIYIGADHRGFALKEVLKAYLAEKGLDAIDLGAAAYDQTDDYVDFAAAVAEKIAEEPCGNTGILICGSGHGMDVVANKFPAVRAAICFTSAHAAQAREHGDSNVLVLAADITEAAVAKEIIDAWFRTPFTGAERHTRRLKKIYDIEVRNFDTRKHFACDD